MKTITTFALAFVLLFVSAVDAQEQKTPDSQPEIKDLVWLQTKIQEGKARLANLSLIHSTKIIKYRTGLVRTVWAKSRKGRKRVRRTYQSSDTDWAYKEFGVALLDLDSGKIDVIKARKDRTNLYVVDPGYELTFDPKPSKLTWNGKNTPFRVLDPNDKPRLVIAIKWIEKPKNPNRESIYVPYSRSLHFQALVLAGQNHIRAVNAEAFQRLDQLGVHSLVEPEKLVTQRFQQLTFERLGLMEQSDPEEFFEFRDCQTCKTKLELSQQADLASEFKGNLAQILPFSPFERAEVRLGLNGSDEFKTTNYAGAVGWMQFTNNGSKKRRHLGTWDIVKAKYLSAQLPSFTEGATDQVRAVMAAVLLHDLNTLELVQKFGTDILQDPDLLAYLAAAYNGGLGSVTTAIKKARATRDPEDNWRDYLKKRETKIYVEEWDYLQTH